MMPVQYFVKAACPPDSVWVSGRAFLLSLCVAILALFLFVAPPAGAQAPPPPPAPPMMPEPEPAPMARVAATTPGEAAGGVISSHEVFRLTLGSATRQIARRIEESLLARAARYRWVQVSNPRYRKILDPRRRGVGGGDAYSSPLAGGPYARGSPIDARGFNRAPGAPGRRAVPQILTRGHWAHFQWTSFQDETFGMEHDGRILGGAVGLDLARSQNLILGVGGNINRISVTTDFNRGEEGHTIFDLIPYASYQIDRDLRVLAMFGLGGSWGSTERGVNLENSGDPVGFRWMVGSQLNYDLPVSGDLFVTALVRMTFGQQINGSLTESGPDGRPVGGISNTIGQIAFGGTGYFRWPIDRYGKRLLLPYFGLTYEYDFLRSDVPTLGGLRHPNDPDHLLIRGGANLILANGVSAGLGIESKIAKEEFSELDYWAVVRVDF